jgi:hypothetical protein
VSHELWTLGIEHVVLERDRVAESWRRRWDTFRLVTPNWTLDLPGAPYAGDDPDGFARREEIVDYLEPYAADLPVRIGVAVDGLEPGPAGGFLLRTSSGQRTADAVVVCTGAYQPASGTVRRGSSHATWPSSTPRDTGTRRLCRPAGSLSLAPASPGARSRRSCASPGVRCSWLAAGRPGARAALLGGTL